MTTSAPRPASGFEAEPELLRVDSRVVRISSAGRVLWPDTGFTKRQMIDYYLSIAAVLLPHLRGRGVTLARFPTGVRGRSWYQVNCRGRPPWMRVQEVTGQGGEILRYCMIEEPAALAWIANLGTIELHPFLGTAERPAEPTALVFDLDPGPPASLAECCRVALMIRDYLADLGLRAVPKTSGSFGLHVFVPLAEGHSFAETKAFARRVAEDLTARNPELVIDRVSRSARRGRVLIDWIQNDESRSTIAPYSLRAMPLPVVSAPLTWDEVAAAAAGRARQLWFGPAQMLDRVERLGDLFAPASSGSVARLPSL